jgi:hypothetical protein
MESHVVGSKPAVIELKEARSAITAWLSGRSAKTSAPAPTPSNISGRQTCWSDRLQLEDYFVFFWRLRRA